MKISSSLTLIAFALSAAGASAVTTYTGPVFDLFDDSATTDTNKNNWTNGTPGAGNDGFISIDYNFATLGAADNGNVNPLPGGTYSVTQTAGNGTGGQFNLAGNSGFTFNLNGGSLNSTSGTFIVNNNTFNVAGGSVTKSGGEFRVGGSSANLTISSGSVGAGSFLVQ